MAQQFRGPYPESPNENIALGHKGLHGQEIIATKRTLRAHGGAKRKASSKGEVAKSSGQHGEQAVACSASVVW